MDLTKITATVTVALGATATFICAAAAGVYILFRFRQRREEEKTLQILKIPPGKVIFFTGANVNCRRSCITRRKRPCGEDCSLTKMLYITDLINSAKKTLDVCIYLITCNDLSHAILNAHSRGVKVRVIVDEDMSTCSESKTNWFRNAGIPVKSKKTTSLMHHKFCVIDYALPERRLLTGSLNWTLQGLAGNFEYVTVTSHPVPVLEYEKEFSRLWSEFVALK